MKKQTKAERSRMRAEEIALTAGAPVKPCPVCGEETFYVMGLLFEEGLATLEAWCSCGWVYIHSAESIF